MRRLGLLLPLLLAVPAAAQQKVVERRISVDADASIRITNMAGLTRIIGWDRDSIAVSGTVAANASFFFGGRGRYAKMGVDRPDETLAEPGSTLEIRVPRAARLYVKSGSAAIDASGLTGEIECYSVGGSIKIEGGLQIVTAETMDGAIEVIGAVEVTRIKGGSGPVTLRRARGDVLASTIGGAIIAFDAVLNRADLKTISGAITYDGGVQPKGTLEATTHSGNITFRLPSTIGAELTVQSFAGTIDTDFFPKGRVPKWTAGGKEWVVALGDGAARIRMESFKGDIRILRR